MSSFRVEVTEVFEDELLQDSSSALVREQESKCWQMYFHCLQEYKSFCDLCDRELCMEKYMR